MVRIGEVYDQDYAIDAQVRSVTVRDNDAGLRVDNATVREGPGARLSFVVRLDRTRERVRDGALLRRRDGTATAGQDYTAAVGHADHSRGEPPGDDCGGGARTMPSTTMARH